jgi:hypothetical protein
VTDANRPIEGQHRRSAGSWLLIGLILVLAVAVPVGLYFVSQMSFGGGSESAASAPAATTQPLAAANAVPAAPIAPAGPAGNPVNPAKRRTMDLLVVDAGTKQPIAGLTAEVTGGEFSGRTGADGHVRVPLPASDHPDGFNLRVRGKNYVPMRMLWTANVAELNDGIFPASYTMEIEHGTKIGGKVVDEAGKPVAGATLTFQFTKHFLNPHQLIAAIAGVNPGHPTVSDAEGNWSFGGAPAYCEQIFVMVRDRRDPNANQGPREAYTPVSDLYAGTATVTLHRAN